MDFKFDWCAEDSSLENEVSNNSVDLVENHILSVNDGSFEITKCCKIDEIKFEDFKISVYNQKNLEKNLINNEKLVSSSLFHTLNSHSDIESGIYEGGFTIWEGSKNLVEYLICKNIHFENQSVLELGCGYALPGIYSIIKRASRVCLQDFNLDVLKYCTIPTTLLNMESNVPIEISFLSGDWRGLTNKIESQSFDVILTAETIYREVHYIMLLNAFKHALKKTGKVYLNAKSHYYGVGGNFNDFVNYVKKDSTFDYEITQTSNSGVLRYVIVLWFK